MNARTQFVGVAALLAVLLWCWSGKHPVPAPRQPVAETRDESKPGGIRHRRSTVSQEKCRRVLAEVRNLMAEQADSPEMAQQVWERLEALEPLEIGRLLAELDAAESTEADRWLRRLTFRRLAELEPLAAAEALASFNSGDREICLGLLAGSPAWKKSSNAAKGVVLLSERFEENARLLEPLLNQCAGEDAEAVLKWATELDQPEAKATALAWLIPWLDGAQLKSAASHARGLPASDAQGQLLPVLTARLANEDLGSALQFVHGLPPSRQRSDSYQALVKTVASQDPVAAARLAAQETVPELQSAGVLAAVAVWTLKEGQQAGDWVMRFNEGELKNQAVRRLVEAWAAASPIETAHWLGSLPPSAAKDAAVKTFAENILKDDHDAAFRWAATISDGTVRNDCLARLAQGSPRAFADDSENKTKTPTPSQKPN